MGGMVLETNMNEIVAQVEAQNRLEKSEVSARLSRAPAGSGALGRTGAGTWAGLCGCGTLGAARARLLSCWSPSKLTGVRAGYAGG